MSASEARPAATIAPVRDRGGRVEVLLLKRHAKSGFMANAYVFPGGRLDEADKSMSLIERLHPDPTTQTSLMEDVGDEIEAAAHIVAALRETFEESGVLLACDHQGRRVAPHPDWRTALNENQRSFESIIVGEGLTLDLNQLAYFAHWITPDIEPRRYSARFFLAHVPEMEAGQHDGVETTHSLWITPQEALERHQQGEFRLAPPQWQVLRDLSHYTSTAAMIAWARSLTRVPPIKPQPFELGGAFALALPGDPEHSQSSPSGEMRRIVLRQGTWSSA